MNIFFDKSISEGVEKHERFMTLIERVDANPDLLYTLPLETLVQVNAYYEEKIASLETKLANLRTELKEEGDAE